MIATRMRQAAAGGQVPPDAPTGLVAAPVSTSQIDLAWTDNATNETGYKIYRSIDGVSYSLIDTISANSTSYSDTTITAGITYYYKVAAYNGAGEVDSNVETANTVELSLISFWELEEASGTRFDAHGTNSLTDTNTVTQAVGKVGAAAQLTAANSESLRRVDNAGLSVGDIDFSFGAWVYLDSVGAEREIIAKGTLGVIGAEYRVQVTAGNVFRLQIQDAAGVFRTVASTATATISTWHLVIAWHDATANTLNIQIDNGSVISAGTSGTIPLDGTNDFIIGSGPSARFWNGRIDQVVFTKRVWVADERASLWNSGNGRAYAYINP